MKSTVVRAIGDAQAEQPPAWAEVVESLDSYEIAGRRWEVVRVKGPIPKHDRPAESCMFSLEFKTDRILIDQTITGSALAKTCMAAVMAVWRRSVAPVAVVPAERWV